MRLEDVPNFVTFTYRDFKNINKESLISECNEILWDNLYNCNSLNDKVDILNITMKNLYDRYVPLKTGRHWYRRCPWISDDIHIAMTERDFLLEEYKRNHNTVVFNRYKTLRNKVTSMIRSSKRAYISSKLDVSRPAKELWKNIRNLGIYGNSEESQVDIDPNMLNNFFTNRNTRQIQAFPCDLTSASADGFSFRCIDVIELMEVVRSIGSSSIGPDTLNPNFIKLLVESVSSPLLHIFNCCLTTSQFPMQWKEALIVPIPKKPASSNLCDYRPISLLNFLAKVLEKIMYRQAMEYIDDHNLLSVCQSGFRSKHSCESALLGVTTDIHEALDRDDLTMIALLDFSKAFDSVNHSILLSKLKNKFQFSSSALKLIKSFLSDRSQRVKLRNAYSDIALLYAGVPQGSILGPLLFILYINDLPEVIKNASIHIYADDVQIYLSRPIGLIDDCVDRLNEDLQSIFQWSLDNNLEINPTKSKCLPVYRSALDKSNLPSILMDGSILNYDDWAKNSEFN